MLRPAWLLAGAAGTTQKNLFPEPRAGARKPTAHSAEGDRSAQGNPRLINPERDTGSIYPGPTASTGTRREMNMTRGLMGTRMIGVDMARRYCCVGAEAAEHEGQDENPACRPDHGIGSRSFRQTLGRNGSGMHGHVACPPVSLHQEDPLIGYLDSRLCRVS